MLVVSSACSGRTPSRRIVAAAGELADTVSCKAAAGELADTVSRKAAALRCGRCRAVAALGEEAA
jgi:hypothetical protein